MTDTATLISQLSSEAAAPTASRSPRYWGVRLVAVLAIYGIAAQLFLGFRPDLATLWEQPLFAAEILLLSLLLITSMVASVIAMYPDSYQKPKFLTLPYAVFFVLAILLGFEVTQAPQLSLLMTGHEMECAMCIAMVAMVPSALMFVVLRKGATVRPVRAGSYAALAASAIGCLTLRLAEADASLMHLISGHYLPTLLFSVVGAVIGKWALKW